MDKTSYIKYVEKTSPKTNEVKTLFAAFMVGGIICMVGEAVGDLVAKYIPSLDIQQARSLTTIIMIFLGSFLTAIGIYDKIGYFAGAGSILPITGFANSIVSTAMEYNKEGVIYGIMAKMFIISGPVIVTGTCASVIVGIIYYFLNVFGVAV